MKKLFAILLAASSTLAVAHDNWNSASGQVWKNSTGLCWRNANWTPATASPDCDGAVAAPKATASRPEAPKQLVTKLTYSADTFFDFDKSTIKPAGKQTLDSVVKNLSKMTLEVVIVVGHTDSVGTEAYNTKLGARRADAVSAYLINKGVPKSRVYTESKGESQSVADNKTNEGRAKNRRVVLEVIGTK